MVKAGGSFIVFDLRVTVGGRACVAELGPESAGQYVFDRGSSWMWRTGEAKGNTNSSRALKDSLLCVDDYMAVDPPAKARLTARGYDQRGVGC